MQSFSDHLYATLNQDFPHVLKWKAFAQWWLIANGMDSRGTAGSDCLVDGSKDGGFDVLARPLPGMHDRSIYVIQSKYVKAMPNLNGLRRFAEAIAAVRGSRRDFDNWLESVRDNLAPNYEELRDNRRHVKFVCITTAKVQSTFRHHLERQGIIVHDRSNIERLYNFYIQGQTPRVSSLKLRIASKMVPITKTDKEQMWVFSAPLKQFAQAYKNHRDLLFAGNIRFALKGENAAKVRAGIDETLKNYPEEFVFSHNGITMVARHVSRRGKFIYLDDPSIVNGAQTVTHIGRKWSNKLTGAATVLVKLIQVLPGASFERLETDIAIRSNTQNKVDFSDLTVSEPSLVSIQKDLLKNRIFLERKRGETPPFSCRMRIPKERLVQLLSCLESDLGPTSAKRKQDLFKRQHALPMIRSYAHANRINDLIAIIWMDYTLRKVLNGFTVKARKRRASLAAFAVYTSIINVLHQINAWKNITRILSSSSDDYLLSESVSRLMKIGVNHMLRCSQKSKKNEPAFYKNKEQTMQAVNSVVRKLKKSARVAIAEIA